MKVHVTFPTHIELWVILLPILLIMVNLHAVLLYFAYKYTPKIVGCILILGALCLPYLSVESRIMVQILDHDDYGCWIRIVFAFASIINFLNSIDLFTGTFPKNYTKDLKSFMITHAFAIAPQLEKDNFKKLSPTGLKRVSLDALSHIVGVLIFYSIWGYNGTKPIHYLSLWSIPNICLSFMLFNFLSFFFDVLSLLMCLSGYEPQITMNGPLLYSSSPSDFWGRRWNLWVHETLKRTLFEPLFTLPLTKNWPKFRIAALGSFLSFFVSGVAHEYLSTNMFAGTNSYPHGTMLLFFVFQFPLCVAEKFVFKILPKSIQNIVIAIPVFPIKLLVTYIVMLPFAPFFHFSFQQCFTHFDAIIPLVIVEH